MKTILFIGFAILAIGGGYCYLFLPKMDYVPVNRTTLLPDFTDRFKLIPAPADFTQSFSWDPLRQARIFRVRKISDVPQEDIYEYNLPPYSIPGDLSTWNLFSNNIFRKEQIKQQEDSIWADILNMYKDTIGYANTCLLSPIIEELLLFQNYPKDDRTLVVYSDNVENLKGFSFLNTDILELLKRNDPAIWMAITGTEKILNLRGITIYFIHRPLNATEAERYRTITTYLKRRLEAYGATVLVQGKVIHH